MRKVILFVASFVLVSVCSGVVTNSNAAALAGSEFKAGRIIDDQLFYDGTAMSADQVQAFLDGKVPVCDTWGTQPSGYNPTMTRAEYGASRGYPPPFVCLRDYSQQTGDRPAETGLCSAYTGGTETAAQIIANVGQACGISPKVLLVLLQKEQSLVTDDWPWSIQYRSATGYGCPDTAPCDAEYYGFFNQVYSAARQFKRYGRDAQWFNYRAGRDNYILYNPNTACGGSNVFIENQATAALYNYTPYQPNTAALNNLYGAGDGCSAYGNRNFWRLYNDWFGPTLVAAPVPTASLLVNGSVQAQVAYGAGITLDWQAEHVTSCTVNPGGYSGVTGTVPIAHMYATTEFNVSCSGEYGNVQDSVMVHVQPPTFGYLREYLEGVSGEAKQPITKPIIMRVDQAEKRHAAGSADLAADILRKTVADMNDMVAKGRLDQQAATAYEQAVNALIVSWQ